MVAKVEWHPGELVPRVGLDPLRGSSVTNLSRPAAALRAGLQSRQYHADVGLVEGGGALVADHATGLSGNGGQGWSRSARPLEENKINWEIPVKVTGSVWPVLGRPSFDP